MSADSLAEYEKVAVSAAKSAGAVIREAFVKKKTVEHKGSVDLVTETDKQCEALISSALREAFPDHSFIGEEESSAAGSTAALTDAPTWMVDPLDGTTNFVHQYPFVCVSIGLAIEQKLVLGVVFNPILNELFTAVQGRGAFLNGQQIHASSTAELGNALLATEIGTTRDPQTVAAIFDRISALTGCMRSVRCSGSCALNLCSVACGRLDAFYEIGFGGCWDVAAGALVLQEAGGTVLDPAGGQFGVMARRVLGTNAHLGDAVAKVLAGCKVSPHEAQAP
ncbi:hypothetical protein WJX72_006139 [[Myrmecia] bisecta]|uniref:Inositol-1-monophosphatase n=1 Tax=[Myrmecia] bisecta TaxID=41462 RepID=A0AAW1Q713_9CHLO